MTLVCVRDVRMSTEYPTLLSPKPCC